MVYGLPEGDILDSQFDIASLVALAIQALIYNVMTQ